MQGRHHVRARSRDIGAYLTGRQQLVIGIDGSRATVGRLTGTERYSVELLSSLANLDPPETIRVYLNAPAPPPGLRFPGTAVPIPGPRFWTLRNLFLEMRRDPPDVLFVPSYVIPPVHPTSVVTIHDLGYLVEPDCHEPIHRRQLQLTTRWNVHASSGIIAVSESTKRDLIERLRVPAERIVVIPHGISTTLSRASDQQIEDFRKRFGIGSRVVLAVGTIQPRKNLVRLIQAFEQLAARDRELQLVFSGASGWQGESILRRARSSPFHERIAHLGYLPDAEMATLYSSATLLAFPSLYEGFGLPVLEAMACGTPVVSANRSALPEIAGDAAILVDPLDSESIGDGIQRLLHDDTLRAESIERGFERTRSFSWHDSAARTLAFLRAIGDNSQRSR